MKEIKDLQQLFAAASYPSTASSEKLRELQNNCASRMDKDSFYVTVNVAAGFTCPWTHNMESALGHSISNLEELMQLVHPAWKEVHVVYAEALLKLIALKRNGPLNDEIVFTTDIPFAVKGGGFRWFKQTTTAGAATNEGNLISYLSQYYVLGDFSALIPAAPVITLRGKAGRRVNLAFQHNVSLLFPQVLEKHFSATQQKIIYAYRKAAVWNGQDWEVPIKAEMANIIGVKLTALDRSVSRLLNVARAVFPEHTAGNIANFINLMNTLFPRHTVMPEGNA